ncbi:VOC family protein [Actinophytocola glycyrrhizae]|uniref:VOC family protein n=1 Tax=Actinophytocola glycyrrhizae TaxID=2044873 RepID=A0ABV9RUX8_9PSEU
MLRIGSTVLGAADVRRAAEFWSRALGYVPRDEIEETWAVLTPPDGNGQNVSLMLSRTPVQEELGAGRVDWQDYRPGFGRVRCLVPVRVVGSSSPDGQVSGVAEGQVGGGLGGWAYAPSGLRGAGPRFAGPGRVDGVAMP